MRRLSVITAGIVAATLMAPTSAQHSIVSAHPLAQWTPATSSSSGSYQALTTYVFDDGSAENSVGIGCGQPVCAGAGTADLVWAQYFDTSDPLFANSSSDTITRIDVAIGNPPGPAGPPAGTTFNVYVFEDPTDSGDPANLLFGNLVTQGSGTNNSPDTDTFEQVSVPPAVVNNGFFVIVTMAHMESTTPPSGVGEFPAALDQLPMSLGRAWVNCTVPGGSWTPTEPQASNCAGGWVELDGAGLPGVFLVRAEGTGTGPTSFCTAKTTTVCGPANVSASGLPSVTATSGFNISAAPTRGCRSGLLLYSNQPTVAGISFGGTGDGLLCLFPSGLRRAGPIESGGTSPATCDGVMAMDMNAFASLNWAATGCAPPAGQTNPAGFLSNLGTTVNTQVWGRDSTSTGQVLSDGLSYTVGP